MNEHEEEKKGQSLEKRALKRRVRALKKEKKGQSLEIRAQELRSLKTGVNSEFRSGRIDVTNQFLVTGVALIEAGCESDAVIVGGEQSAPPA